MRGKALLVVGGLFLIGCGGPAELPRVPPPGAQRVHDRGYSVLVQETYETETVFVVSVREPAKSDRSKLLAIANELHNARGERRKTVVAFQVPGEVPLASLPLESQWAHAFAMAIIDSATGDQTLEFGIFN
jgi:hypothetical protein